MKNYTSVETKEHWNSLLSFFPEANFLQSYEWGEFQEKIGKKIFRFVVETPENQAPTALFQIIKEQAKRGNYLTVAGGPLLHWETASETLLKDIFQFLKELAQTEKCLFIRFRPQALDTPELRSTLKKLGLILAPMHLTADLTLQLDLTQPTEVLLQNMRKNTRYEVRQVEKKNITVKQSQDPKDIEEFYKQQLAVAQKQHFVPFSLSFLQEQFSILSQNDQAVLFSSYQGNTLLASAFIIFSQKEAVYHYGISTPENDRLPGAYACQWAAIQEAQKRGCTRYNFWGIAPKEETHHRFAGVSIFKRGFGGEEVAYLPAHDIPVSLRYWGVYLFEVLRKKVRKLS